jgi:hypothetical protein
MSKLPKVQRILYFLRVSQSFRLVTYRKFIGVNKLCSHLWLEWCEMLDNPNLLTCEVPYA